MVIEEFKLFDVFVDGKEVGLGVVIKLVDSGFRRVRVGLELHNVHEATKNFCLDPELGVVFKGDDHL